MFQGIRNPENFNCLLMQIHASELSCVWFLELHREILIGSGLSTFFRKMGAFSCRAADDLESPVKLARIRAKTAFGGIDSCAQTRFFV